MKRLSSQPSETIQHDDENQAPSTRTMTPAEGTGSPNASGLNHPENGVNHPEHMDVVTQLVLGPIAIEVRNAPRTLADRWVEVEEVITQSALHDGVAPFSEQFLRGMEEQELNHWHVLARVNGVVRGVAAVDPTGPAVELAVHPGFRKRGIGRALFRAVRAHASSVGLGEPRNIYTGSIGLTWWAHGDLPAARAAAATVGASVVRELLVMEVKATTFLKTVSTGDSSGSGELGEPGEPRALGSSQAGATLSDSYEDATAAQAPWDSQPGVQVLNYTESARKFGESYVDSAWLAVNNEAFHWHPEQGGWNQKRLDRARKTSWYDPNGVLFLWQDDADTPGASAQKPVLLGFHWTKLSEGNGDGRVGEVYVIGLANTARGKGWGRALTAEGIRYLISQGATGVELYVEGDNEPAVKAYEALGFVVVERHTAWKL